MGLGDWKENTSISESPISVFLETYKGEFVVYDKEQGKNIVHNLNNFIVLNIGYTIKGKHWNDTVKKFTNTYYSNEIQSTKNQELYVIDVVFRDGKSIKTKILQGVYANIKEQVKSLGAALNAGITILDLNDGLIKEFFVAGGSAFDQEDGVIKTLQSFNPESKCSITINKMYAKQGSEDYITEEQLDGLKGSEAAQYKPRYIYKVNELDKATEEEIEAAEEYFTQVKEYLRSRHEWYKKEYGEGNVPQYAQPEGIESDEEFAEKVKAEQKAEAEKTKTKKTEKVNEEEISIEDIPF